MGPFFYFEAARDLKEVAGAGVNNVGFIHWGEISREEIFF